MVFNKRLQSIFFQLHIVKFGFNQNHLTMRKTILKAVSFALILAAVGYSCSKEQHKSNCLPGGQEDSNSSSLRHPSSIENPTLSFFATRARDNGDLFGPAPSDYIPTKLNEWTYSGVYLYQQGNDNNPEILEVYTFNDPAAQAFAAAGEKKDLWEDFSDHKLKCSGPGAGCGKTGGGTPCIVSY